MSGLLDQMAAASAERVAEALRSESLQALQARAKEAPRGALLKRFDLAKRKSEQVLPGVTNYFLTANGKKALVLAGREDWSIVDVSGPPPAPVAPPAARSAGRRRPVPGGVRSTGAARATPPTPSLSEKASDSSL